MNNLNGIKVVKVKGTMFVALPVNYRSPIKGGCSCNYCKANPDKTPMWDTLAVNPDADYSWTVHFPEIAVDT